MHLNSNNFCYVDFIEINPNPIVQINKVNASIHLNMAARLQFPTLFHEKIRHPLLHGVIDEINEAIDIRSRFILFIKEVDYLKQTYEEQIFLYPNEDIIYVQISNITLSKKIIDDDFNKKISSYEKIYNGKIKKLNDEIRTFYDVFSKNREQHNLALKSAGAGSWHWNLINNIVFWDDSMNELLGLHPKTYVTSYKNAIEFIHPQDMNRVNNILQNSLVKKTPLNFDCRVIQASGLERLWNIRGNAANNEFGEPISVAGICLDITP